MNAGIACDELRYCTAWNIRVLCTVTTRRMRSDLCAFSLPYCGYRTRSTRGVEGRSPLSTTMLLAVLCFIDHGTVGSLNQTSALSSALRRDLRYTSGPFINISSTNTLRIGAGSPYPLVRRVRRLRVCSLKFHHLCKPRRTLIRIGHSSRCSRQLPTQ